jgi:hypothetical protein
MDEEAPLGLVAKTSKTADDWSQPVAASAVSRPSEFRKFISKRREGVFGWRSGTWVCGSLGRAVLDRITSVNSIPVLAFNRPFPMETTKFGSKGPKHLHREVQSRNVGVIGDNSGK